MKKMNLANGIQRLIIAACIMLVMTGVFMTRTNVVRADDEDDKKTSQCSLQSVTLEIGGEEYTFEGEMQPFVVDTATEWKTFFSEDNFKVVDYKVLADEECTHEGGHDKIQIWVNDCKLLEYVSGNHTYSEITEGQWEEMDWNGVNVCMDMGDTGAGVIEVWFAKEYAISFDGESLEGAKDVVTGESPSLPTTYIYRHSVSNLPVLEKEGYMFEGWTWETETDSETEPIMSLDTGQITGGAVTITANWSTEVRTDISTYEWWYNNNNRMYSGDEITPDVEVYYMDTEDEEVYLSENSDYIVLYKNNIEVADAGSDNPPTIIVKGIGKYTGTLEGTFSIIKAELYVESFYLPSVVAGTTLSEVDLSSLVVRSCGNNDTVVSGTWEWSDPNTAVVKTEEVEEDEENEEDEEDEGCSYYGATFTPTDTKNYEILTTNIPLNVSNWEISFANEDTFTYTGKECKPEVIVTNGQDKMSEDEDYKISYVNNVNAGGKTDAKAPTVVIEGIGDYAGTKNLTFTIEKATPSIETIPTASAIEEGKKLSDSTLTGGVAVNPAGETIKGTFTWKDGTVVPALADGGVTKYTVVFTPTDVVNYEVVEMNVVITVNEKVEETTPNPTPNPTPDPTPNPTPESTPEIVVGDEVADKDNKATYQVTKSQEGEVEVTYVAPTSKSKTVSIPATVTLADGTTAKVTAIAAKAFKGNTKLQTVTIGKNVTTIGKEAFSGCKNLKKVKSAKNVTSIGKSAFENCKNLNSIAMGSNVTTIGEKAFYKCTKLTKITIPKNVKSIGKSAFQGCSKLKTITIKTTKLTKKNVGKNAFKGIPSKATIDVPNSKVKAYKSILQARGVSKNATIK